MSFRKVGLKEAAAEIACVIEEKFTPMDPEDVTRQLMLYEYAVNDYLATKAFFDMWEFMEYLRDLRIRLFYARIEPWGA